ncbi:MAG: radical SAM family heme chaperone HemW [Candidatus Limnocylindria bacterium]
MLRDPHHLYVHVPFCRLVCAYCDFVTVGGRADDIPRYTDALLRELAVRPAPGELRTVYFGGGTPSLLSGAQVGRVIGAAQDRWSHVALEEVTLEANPSERERPDWMGLRAAGVTRISLGVQSLRDAELVALARGHTAGEARAAFTSARKAEFDNISIDLIYGIPGQSLDDWRAGLDAAMELAPDHLSCYALQLALAPDEWAAPPRPGALRWRNRMVPRQDDGLASDQYRLAEEMLGAAGYRHYELSSWALPGRESRHNLAYWARRAYTGIGAGAHSYDGAAERSWNRRDLDGYVEAAEAGERPMVEREELDERTRAFEAVALSLRRVAGMSRREFSDEFGADPVERYAKAVSETIGMGLLEVDGDTVRLSADGRLFASEVLVSFAD